MSDPSHAPITPLRDLRVLEFTQNVMGPSGGLVLADLGADVVKIEPTEGEATRYLGGFASGFFNYFNRNKRSLAVDLKSERGRALVHRLATKADIVLENYAPGTMERLGCGYETLAASIRGSSIARSKAISPAHTRNAPRSTRWPSSNPASPI